MSKPTKAMTIADVIEIRQARPMVSSLKIAELFKRPHKNVLASIRKEFANEISRLELKPVDFVDKNGDPLRGAA